MEILTRMLRAAARCRSRITLAFLAALSIALAPGEAAAADESLEYGVKAAFLYKFGSYVEWPATAFISPASPFNLCLVGSGDPFGATLDKVIGGKRINDRDVVIRRLKTAERAPACHILYIGGAETQRGAQIVDAVRGSSVLTVSDAGRSGSGTAIIDFVVADNRVRFEIDDEAAAQNGLVISSKLMSLALNTKRRTVQGAPK